MDGFGDDFGQNDIDPAAEFLAREQDQLAGLEDDLPIASEPQPIPTVQVLKEDNYFANEPDYGSFELLGNTNDVTFNSDAILYDSPVNDEINGELVNGDIGEKMGPKSMTPPPKIEPEKIRIWRENQALRLEEKDSAEEVKKVELHEQAKKELEEWYKHHNELIGKNKAANRNAEKELVAEADVVEPGTEWERIAKLCDFNPKASKHSKDVSRMRSIILQLKQTPPAKA